jgi:hypothetical protein
MYYDGKGKVNPRSVIAVAKANALCRKITTLVAEYRAEILAEFARLCKLHSGLSALRFVAYEHEGRVLWAPEGADVEGKPFGTCTAFKGYVSPRTIRGHSRVALRCSFSDDHLSYRNLKRFLPDLP